MTLPQITATGRLGADPELSFTPAGKAVANFSLACDENRKTPAGEWEKVGTTWLRVAIWEASAEAVAEHLKKGDLVTVIGSLTTREYDRKDGSKGLSVEVKSATVSKHLPKVAQPGQTSGWGQQPATTNTPADPWNTQPPAEQEPPF